MTPNCTSMAYRALLVGLINSAQKYLTAESFNFRVNASSTIMKVKQIWTIEFLKDNSCLVHIRSSLRRYLASDNNGKVTCDQEAPSAYSNFVMITQADGKVSFQSDETKRYLGGAEDNITCFAQAVSESEKWVLHLAIHPNINLFSPGKKRYLRYDAASNVVRCDSELPWGPDCVMTLIFDFKGTRSLSVPTLWNCNPHLYVLRVRSGLLCLSDGEGRVLSSREGYVRSLKSDSPSKDELFSPDPSPGQVTIRSLLNAKYISIRSGEEHRWPECGQPRHRVSTRARERMSECMYVCLFAGCCFQGPKNLLVSLAVLTDNCWFSLVYNGPRVGIKTSDGKFVTTKSNGQLAPVTLSPGPAQEFILQLTNRPLLILQSDYGFVGFGPGTSRLDGNRCTHEASKLSCDEDGYYQFKLGESRVRMSSCPASPRRDFELTVQTHSPALHWGSAALSEVLSFR
uniref:Fascin-like n=1 Tax=Callorhinchus milii TaxID=7868 RepID=A0A4W3II19_CALMI